jgi:hypothetical protein
MNRYEFLGGVHERLTPRSYLEVGINDGRSLALSRSRTIGVDPAFKIVVEVACDVQLVKEKSDDFFARPNPLEWFPNGAADLSFVDGMHLFEFALRDFMNAERLSEPSSVIVIDDVMPRSIDEAARDRHTLAWTGDVYKVGQVLERYRPDLTVIAANTKPTGVLLVTGLDPSSTVLTDKYDEIIAEYVRDDPQDVPDDLMHRRHAADPDALLASGVWQELVKARDERRRPDADALEQLAELRGTATYTLKPPVPEPWPKVAPKPPPPPPPPPLNVRQRAARKVAREIRDRWG